MDETKIKYRTNFFSKERTIIFSPESIRLFCDKVLITQFNKETINDFRFGVNWISGLEFTIGRLYSIDIRNNDKQILKIRLRSLYGINKTNLHKKYCEIIDALFDHYFKENITNSFDKIENGEKILIGGVIFNKDGVSFDTKNSNIVKWEDLKTQAYTYYFTLSSKINPDFYKAFTYLTDWNAAIVLSLTRFALKNKGLYHDK